VIASEFLVSDCGIVLESREGLYRFIGYYDDNGNLVKCEKGKWFSKTKTMSGMNWRDLNEN